MKTTTAAALVAFTLLEAAFAAPVSQPERRQLSIPGLGGSGTGTIPSLPSGILGGGSGISIPGLSSGTSTSSTSAVSATSTSTTSSGLSGLGGLEAGAASGASTENDVVDNAGCTPLTVIFARGTSETGNVGTVAGPPMLSAIESALGQTITKQGVDYAASAAGNANLGADGGPTMAQLVTQSLSQCPQSKIVLSGYSQGAMVVHNAATQSGFPANQIAGTVLFGDPLNGSAVQGVDTAKVKEICADGDSVCNGGGFAITPAHLSYGDDAQEAAAFAIQAAGL